MPLSTPVKTPLDKSTEDRMRIKGGKISLHFNVFSGKQGDFFVLYAPAINVSGYGKTELEAEEFLNIEVETFCEDVMSMSTKERESFLTSIGFKKGTFNSKNFSKAYVDADGKLQDFDQGTLEHKVLTTAA